MPTVLNFEVKVASGWKCLATQRQGMPPGTISDNLPDGRRDIYVTQVLEDHATISRLRGGIDIEQGTERIIDHAELHTAQLIARLSHGESHEMTLRPGRVTTATLVRYRCIKEP